MKPNGIISLSELYGNPDYPLRRKEKEWAKLASLKLIDEFGTFLVYLLNFTKTD